MQLDFLQKNLKSCLVQISNSYHLYESIDNGWVPRFRSYFWVLGSSVPFCRSVVSDSVTPRTAAHQASLSSTNSQSLLKLMFVESMMPSNHLTLWPPLLLLPSVFPRARIFYNESVLCNRWPNIGVSASASVLPMNIQDLFPLGLTGLILLRLIGVALGN